jgi:hypothetical protein
VHSILTLHERGWSQRRIARALGIDRGTVLRHVRAAEAVRAAHAPPGASAVEPGPAAAIVSNAANAPTGAAAGEGTGAAVANVSNTANAPIGSDVSKAANAPTGSGGRTSDCEPYRAFI